MTNNVLIITNKGDITSDFIVKELRARSVNFYRFNTDELTKSITVILDFMSDSFMLFDAKSERTYDLQRFTSVYYRRPELPSLDKGDMSDGELQFVQHEILYTLEGIYKILRKSYWVSPLYSIREAENKVYQLHLARTIGFDLPNSIITNSFENLQSFFEANNKDCIIKPIKSGLIEEPINDKVIFTSRIRELPMKEDVEISPAYIQSHIEKKADIRVTIVGKKIFATKINSQTHEQTITDWRKGELVLEHERIKLPNDLSTKCILLLKELGLKFGALDFVLDKQGNYIFLEINPNGQWGWIEKQTGYKISEEIVNLLLNENF